jgi:hypothetical protein
MSLQEQQAQSPRRQRALSVRGRKAGEPASVTEAPRPSSKLRPAVSNGSTSRDHISRRNLAHGTRALPTLLKASASVAVMHTMTPILPRRNRRDQGRSARSGSQARTVAVRVRPVRCRWCGRRDRGRRRRSKRPSDRGGEIHMLIFLVGALLGVLMGGTLCVRYLLRSSKRRTTCPACGEASCRPMMARRGPVASGIAVTPETRRRRRGRPIVGPVKGLASERARSLDHETAR